MLLRSYAKINLTLDILGRRPDGYHEIDTVFQQIDLFDEIEIAPADEKTITVTCTDPSIPPADNICLNAAHLMIDHFDLRQGVRISIKKQIPVGAGLSGGSSNAAAVIRGMVHCFGLTPGMDELEEIGAALGMDVCFHLRGGTCRGRGRGEILEDLPPFPTHFAVVVYPGFSVRTADAYAGLDYSRIGRERRTPSFIRSYDAALRHNDFEYSVFDAYPELAAIKELLGPGALLSGSGSCVVGLYRDVEEAQRMYRAVCARYRDVFLTRTLNRTIVTADEMGFCAGVRRAVEGASELVGSGKVYVIGKLVHNPAVRERLIRVGVVETETPDSVAGGTAVIASHGAPDAYIEDLVGKGVAVVDLTCPVVRRLHRITRQREGEGRRIVILGDRHHSEVKGLAGNLTDARVINDPDDLKEDDTAVPITLVCQTTMDPERFSRVSEDLKRRCADIEVLDTICAATRKRLESAAELASKSDVVFVIGGKDSANTKRLYERCAGFCEAYHIEDSREIDPRWLFEKDRIGVTAGASTPAEEIRSVIESLRLVM